MIGSISGASALLSQLLNPGSGSTSPLGATSSGSPAVSASGATASGTSATQDLQSFMSALIQELRQSGAAATGTAATSVASGGGASIAAAGSRHGHGGRAHGGQSQVSNQLESLLQQLGSPSAIASATGSVTSLTAANGGSQTASNLQAAFQRLMQDVSAMQKPRGTVHATA